MHSSHENESDGPRRDDRWTFPAPKSEKAPHDGEEEPLVDEEDDDDPPLDSILISDVSEAEALEISERLEGNGIPTHLERDPSGTNADAVRILVSEQHRELARDALGSEVDPDEEREMEEDRILRMIQDFYCPQCEKQTLVADPLGSGWRWVKRLLIIFIAVPIVIVFVVWASNDRVWMHKLNYMPTSIVSVWFLIVLALAASLITPHRIRRCVKCGWDSKNGARVPRNRALESS